MFTTQLGAFLENLDQELTDICDVALDGLDMTVKSFAEELDRGRLSYPLRSVHPDWTVVFTGDHQVFARYQFNEDDWVYEYYFPNTSYMEFNITELLEHRVRLYDEEAVERDDD